MTPFTRLASIAAALVAVCNLAYATSFLVVRPEDGDTGGTMASIFLMLGGLLTIPVLIAICRRIGAAGMPEIATLALVFGVLGAAGAAIHGAHDLAVQINPPDVASGDAPSQIDPRGFLTFGCAAISLFALAAGLARDAAFGPRVARLAATLGALLVVVYVGRLVILDADSAAIVLPAALAGFIVSPLWYATLAARLAPAGAARARPAPAGG